MCGALSLGARGCANHPPPTVSWHADTSSTVMDAALTAITTSSATGGDGALTVLTCILLATCPCAANVDKNAASIMLSSSLSWREESGGGFSGPTAEEGETTEGVTRFMTTDMLLYVVDDIRRAKAKGRKRKLVRNRVCYRRVEPKNDSTAGAPRSMLKIDRCQWPPPLISRKPNKIRTAYATYEGSPPQALFYKELPPGATMIGNKMSSTYEGSPQAGTYERAFPPGFPPRVPPKICPSTPWPLPWPWGEILPPRARDSRVLSGVENEPHGKPRLTSCSLSSHVMSCPCPWRLMHCLYCAWDCTTIPYT